METLRKESIKQTKVQRILCTIIAILFPIINVLILSFLVVVGFSLMNEAPMYFTYSDDYSSKVPVDNTADQFRGKIILILSISGLVLEFLFSAYIVFLAWFSKNIKPMWISLSVFVFCNIILLSYFWYQVSTTCWAVAGGTC